MTTRVDPKRVGCVVETVGTRVWKVAFQVKSGSKTKYTEELKSSQLILGNKLEEAASDSDNKAKDNASNDEDSMPQLCHNNDDEVDKNNSNNDSSFKSYRLRAMTLEPKKAARHKGKKTRVQRSRRNVKGKIYSTATVTIVTTQKARTTKKNHQMMMIQKLHKQVMPTTTIIPQ